MKKSTKAALIVAGVAIAAGLLGGAALFVINSFNFSKLVPTAEAVSDDVIISEDFDDITINAATFDISVQPSSDGKNHVSFRANETGAPKISVKNGVLTIEATANITRENWTDFLKINAVSSRLDIYLAEDAMRSVCVALSTGELKISGIDCQDMALSENTGDIWLSDLNIAGGLAISSSTGETYLSDVIAGSAITIAASTGDINLKKCDAFAIDIETSTGDVIASLLSSKIYDISTSTGECKSPASAPEGSGAGPCKIRTSTGDIRVVEE